jgi:hypothetical protein
LKNILQESKYIRIEYMISTILSSNEIIELLNNPIVQNEKANLSDTQKEVKFEIALPDVIKTKIENTLSIDLSQVITIPMRWIKGDTLPHIDRGESDFNNTYLIYLTDSIGSLIIDGQSYSITAGDCHIFNEGLEHYTINTENSERLMIGPMSESGFRVGVPPSIIYFANETDATNETDAIIEYHGNYTIQTVNDISSWILLKNVGGVNPTQGAGPYYADDELIPVGVYYVYAYIAPTPAPTPHRFYMGSLFTNNAQVYYKSNSLSTGGGGSGVRNSRHKQRRT